MAAFDALGGSDLLVRHGRFNRAFLALATSLFAGIVAVFARFAGGLSCLGSISALCTRKARVASVGALAREAAGRTLKAGPQIAVPLSLPILARTANARGEISSASLSAFLARAVTNTDLTALRAVLDTTSFLSRLTVSRFTFRASFAALS